MPLNAIERELAAVGISVASGCKPCTDYHVKAVRKAGASEEDIKKAISDALTVRVTATNIIRSHALVRLGQENQRHIPANSPDTNRITELVSMGAAFGVNCASSLKEHLAAAESVGISPEEIDELMKLAAFIKDRAASHVERLVGMRDAEDAAKVAAQYKATVAR